VLSDPPRASVGLVLNPEGRGKGLGKLTVQVLSQLCWSMGLRASMGTMNSNAPMRGVMRSLGAEERVEITELPGRGIVAELAYTVNEGDWEEIGMNVAFVNR
jgi:GNAT superfamily N-acetyltransferase